MPEAFEQFDFYAPDLKELGLGVCYILEQAGGCLTFTRVVDVLGDFLQIPDKIRSVKHCNPRSAATTWGYYLAWTCTHLRNHGFMTRNDSSNWGMCVLTDHGHNLGRWAVQIYQGENPDLPPWVAAFVQPVLTRMRRLLDGHEHRRPPDYELCRWVRYCYLLNQPALGASVFSLILADHVEPSLFRQAERQARILRLRAQEDSETLAPDGRDAIDQISVAPPPKPARAVSKSVPQPERRKVGGTVAQPEDRTVPRPRVSGSLDGDVRRWVVENFPPGTCVRGLVRRVHNQVRAVTDEGVVVLSSKTQHEDLVPWKAIESAYEILLAQGHLDNSSVGGRSSFVCALLANLPGVQPVPGQCAVTLAKPDYVLSGSKDR